MSGERRTPEGRLLRRAVDTMETALKGGPKQGASLSVRASSDGSLLGNATWTRDTGWKVGADVMTSLKQRGGGYVSLKVERSW